MVDIIPSGVTPRRGGPRRPIWLGPWLQSNMAPGAVYYAGDLYVRYRAAADKAYEDLDEANKVPMRQRHRRRILSRSAFLVYLYRLRRLGWIDYLRDKDGKQREEPSFTTAGKQPEGWSPRLPFGITPTGLDADWTNIQRSYEDLI